MRRDGAKLAALDPISARRPKRRRGALPTWYYRVAQGRRVFHSDARKSPTNRVLADSVLRPDGLSVVRRSRSKRAIPFSHNAETPPKASELHLSRLPLTAISGYAPSSPRFGRIAAIRWSGASAVPLWRDVKVGSDSAAPAIDVAKSRTLSVSRTFQESATSNLVCSRVDFPGHPSWAESDARLR